MKRKTKFIVIALTAIMLLSGCGSGGTKITKTMYDKIENGMTIEQVEEILGEGEENARTETAGIIIANYQWINKDGSNIQIMFQDGKVNTKAQAGLK
ncbi:DUF3862 domain-containing protein [Proteiniborus sp.]|uniref:DUF3862 domain-containing protein n=1 Tax=Proteiniborus sp. TaxID=2079015 RepID=UPI00332F9880